MHPRRGPGDNTSGPTPPGFAIVGTGRSGTGYVSAILRESSVDCGHERWWTPIHRRRRSGLDGDSSWLALPGIEAGTWSGPVVHVTRHPVDVVSSLVGIGFFTGQVCRDFADYAVAHEPYMADLPPLEASVEWWARWNARCVAVADITIRVEDLPGRLGDLAAVIGFRLDQHRVGRVSRTVNQRHRADVDAVEVWRLLNGRGRRFGYGDGSCD